MPAIAQTVARRLFYRHRTVRELAAKLRRVLGRDQPLDLAHLTLFHERVDGPVQRDEALFLYGLLRVIRPQTVVEIGFLAGRSALNFLAALEPTARLYSFDIQERWGRRARELFGHDSRFTFVLRSQSDVTAADVDHRPVDFVFLDASHDLLLNQATFTRLLPLLSERVIVAVHDTGTVPRRLFPSWHWLLDSDAGWVGDEYEGRPGNRAFVNWLLEVRPEFAQMHFHATTTIRCGITLIQRGGPLPRPDEPPVPSRTA